MDEIWTEVPTVHRLLGDTCLHVTFVRSDLSFWATISLWELTSWSKPRNEGLSPRRGTWKPSQVFFADFIYSLKACLTSSFSWFPLIGGQVFKQLTPSEGTQPCSVKVRENYDLGSDQWSWTTSAQPALNIYTSRAPNLASGSVFQSLSCVGRSSNPR